MSASLWDVLSYFLQGGKKKQQNPLMSWTVARQSLAGWRAIWWGRRGFCDSRLYIYGLGSPSCQLHNNLNKNVLQPLVDDREPVSEEGDHKVKKKKKNAESKGAATNSLAWPWRRSCFHFISGTGADGVQSRQKWPNRYQPSINSSCQELVSAR